MSFIFELADYDKSIILLTGISLKKFRLHKISKKTATEAIEIVNKIIETNTL